jgi:hypothetical protein|eukprot:COSAG06_NODE_1403_length_9565_cov_3.285231_13_plen_92_part_00
MFKSRWKEIDDWPRQARDKRAETQTKVFRAQTVDVTVEASQFLAGISGHAVRAGNFSRQVHIVGNHISQVGQGGVKLGKKTQHILCNAILY